MIKKESTCEKNKIKRLKANHITKAQLIYRYPPWKHGLPSTHPLSKYLHLELSILSSPTVRMSLS